MLGLHAGEGMREKHDAASTFVKAVVLGVRLR